jgi:Flp pilus assembly protein TadD
MKGASAYRKNMLFGAGLLLLAIVCLIQCSRAPSAFVSLDPDVKFTGMASCQSCHEKIYDSYLQTGMGKSYYRPDTALRIEAFGPDQLVYDSFSNFYYHPFWTGNEMFVREFRMAGNDTVFQRTEKVDFIVGSGHQTRSYIMDRNGYLYEIPITWYVRKQLWDLSPGYDNGQNSRFSREIGEECMACHTGQFDYLPGSKHRYKNVSLGIDCERCHGPGEVHVKRMEAGKEVDVGEVTDYSIVNPAKLPLAKQFDLCQQCHLQGVNVLKAGRKSVMDFRPAMDLEASHAVFIEWVEDPDAFGIASHAERLQQSKCFQGSNGALNCTTCHDPHKSIRVTDTMVYVNQCLKCHETQFSCSAPQPEQMTMGGNCISCHMPSGGTRDIPHVSFHDHKIRVLGKEAETVNAEKVFLKLLCASSDTPSQDLWGKALLQYYERQEKDEAYLKAAAGRLNAESKYERARIAFHLGKMKEAEKLIREALENNQDEPYYRFQLGEILEAQGNFNGAFEAYSAVFSQNPEAFEAGLKAGVTLLKARQGDPDALNEAEALFNDLMTKKPSDERLLANLGFVKMNQGNFPEAEALFQKALAMNPDYRLALENLALVQRMLPQSQ